MGTAVGDRVIPDEELEALIFDIDGTLIDTMPTFFPSWVETTKKHGLSITEDQFYSFAGKTLPDIIRVLCLIKDANKPATDEFIAQFLEDKKQAHHEYEQVHGPPKPINIVIDIAKAAIAKGIKVGCATSGRRVHVDAHLKATGLTALFPVVVCAEEVAHGKPAPDVYLEAARQLGVDPKKCRAYEDGETGMHSAWSAGMQVVDVRFMEGYPMSDVLRARVLSEVPRPWLEDTQ
eukprot:m.62323 g.62323  ORF g.62323 m.62323 type:complete len:234 (-) comp23133_c0_seq1:27-728(-)